MYSHELLEEYVSAFTLSETPFDPWAKHIGRRYVTDAGSLPFVEGKTFRAVWCAYARVLDLEGDMSCRQCGESPENIIWDGVMLAYAKRFVTKDLRPPTTVDDDAPVCPRHPCPKKQWLGYDNSARKRVHVWMQRGGLSRAKPIDDDDEQEQKKKEIAYEQQMLEFPSIVEFLRSVDSCLGCLFVEYVGRPVADKKYTSFFNMASCVLQV